MKQLNIFSVFILASLLLLFSCEKAVTNVELPKQEKKLVVYAYISPEDSLISVHVSESHPIWQPYSGGYYETVKNAHVKITGNGTEAHVPYDQNSDTYILSTSLFPIIPGAPYGLLVSTPDGKSVQASCTVPFNTNQSVGLVAVDTITEEWGGKKLRVKVRFTDIVGETNYYRVGGVWKYIDLYAPTQDTLTEEMYPKYNFEYFSDMGKDGQVFTAELVYWIYENADWMQPIGMELKLLTTDVHYYNFHKSLENYVGEDPFSEPTMVYTNMIGGLGVFAAYRLFAKNEPLK